MNSNLDYSLNLTGTLASDKLGITTTVKEQVDHIEMALDTFKKTVDNQKKLQSQLQLQLKKLDEKTHKDFNEMFQQTAKRASQLTDTFKNENSKQAKEFEYMQMQSTTLTEEHTKLNEISQQIGGRSNQMQKLLGV